MMIFDGVLVGCVLLFIFVVKKHLGGCLFRYLFEDPCEGDGNFRDPVEFYYEEESEEDADTP
jgi:hypothetical protein